MVHPLLHYEQRMKRPPLGAMMTKRMTRKMHRYVATTGRSLPRGWVGWKDCAGRCVEGQVPWVCRCFWSTDRTWWWCWWWCYWFRCCVNTMKRWNLLLEREREIERKSAKNGIYLRVRSIFCKVQKLSVTPLPGHGMVALFININTYHTDNYFLGDTKDWVATWKSIPNQNQDSRRQLSQTDTSCWTLISYVKIVLHRELDRLSILAVNNVDPTIA